jgi:surface antigen
MTRAKVVTTAMFGALLLAGCAQTTSGGGGAIGAYASPLAGSPAGGIAGNVVGAEMDASALRKAREAELRALESGRSGVPVQWKSGSYRGEVIPGTAYQVNTYNCRDYTHTIYGPGQPQSARGTACRQPNGTWQPVT